MRWLHPGAVVLLLALGVLPVGGRAQPAGPASAAQDLRASAARDRAFADGQQQRADAWRELARQARSYAEGTSDPETKASWLKDAEDREARAREIEADVARVRARAAEKEARAAQLEPAPGEPPAPQPPVPAATAPGPAPPAPAAPAAAAPAGERDCRKRRPEDLIGVWRDRKTGEPLAIALASGAQAGDLASAAYEGHTMDRVWEGRYDAGAPCGGVRMTFRYQPKAEEMKASVPPWARQAVQGKLEWTLEIVEPRRCGGAELEARWYPGEITWRDDGEGQEDGARVSGRGKPRTLELDQDIVLSGTRVSAPSIAVAVEGQADPYVLPLEHLVKLERFDVLLTLPQELAKAAGARTTVTVENLTNPDSTSLVVTTAPGALERPFAIYQLESPATIADYGQEGRRDANILSLKPGDRIALTARNGDLIQVSHGDAKARFLVYDTWVQAGIARHRIRLEELRAQYTSDLSAAGKSRAERELAHWRLRMVQNALALLAAPDLVDPVKYEIGAFYLEKAPPFVGVVEQGDERRLPVLQRTKMSWYGPGQPNAPPPTAAGWSPPAEVVWTSREEQDVLAVITETRERLRKDLGVEVAKAYTLGLYNAVASSTGMGAWWVLVGGRDIFGNKVSGLERFMTGVGMVSGLILGQYVSAKLDFLRTPEGMGVGARRQAEMLAIVAKGSERLPARLNGKRPVVPPATSTKPARPQVCTRPPVGSPDARKPTIENPTAPTPEDLAYIRQVYGPDARPLRTSPEMQAIRQSYTTCNGQAMCRGLQKQTGRSVTDGELLQRYYRLLNEPGNEKFRAKFDARMKNPDKEFWFDNEDIELLAASMQGESISVTDRALSVPAMKAWQERGWVVKDIINTPISEHSTHAVLVEDFGSVPGPHGDVVTHVNVTDSNVGWTIQVPLCEYEAIRAPHDRTVGTQLLRFAPRPTIQRRDVNVPPR